MSFWAIATSAPYTMAMMDSVTTHGTAGRMLLRLRRAADLIDETADGLGLGRPDKVRGREPMLAGDVALHATEHDAVERGHAPPVRLPREPVRVEDGALAEHGAPLLVGDLLGQGGHLGEGHGHRAALRL